MPAITDYQGRRIQACHDQCPAVTGRNYGTVQFCPMVEWERHRNDDDTECCRNFQCCADRWEAAGMGDIASQLVAARDYDIPVVHLDPPASPDQAPSPSPSGT